MRTLVWAERNIPSSAGWNTIVVPAIKEEFGIDLERFDYWYDRLRKKIGVRQAEYIYAYMYGRLHGNIYTDIDIGRSKKKHIVMAFKDGKGDRDFS